MHGSAGSEFDTCCRGTEGPLCQLSTLQVSVGCVLGDLCVFDSTLFLYLPGLFFLEYISPVLFIHPSFIYLFIFYVFLN